MERTKKRLVGRYSAQAPNRQQNVREPKSAETDAERSLPKDEVGDGKTNPRPLCLARGLLRCHAISLSAGSFNLIDHITFPRCGCR